MTAVRRCGSALLLTTWALTGGGVAVGADGNGQGTSLAQAVDLTNETAMRLVSERFGTNAVVKPLDEAGKGDPTFKLIAEGLTKDAAGAGNQLDPFAAAWRVAFDKDVTKNGFMWQIADHRYAEGALGTLVEVDFAGDTFCLTLLLPKDPKLTGLTHAAWKELVLAAKPRPVGVALPRLKIGDVTFGEAGLSVTKPAPPPVGLDVSPAKEVRVRFDQPFVFAVRHKRTGLLVQAGTAKP